MLRAEHLELDAVLDGMSDLFADKLPFLTAMDRLRRDRRPPIHAITFGDANRKQLEGLASLTGGRLFRAEDDLAATLRSAKGQD
ncbi:MAG TPA: hypothetical protein VFR34_15085 [Paracoccaceae bacterium]|nr:hypothetical protein [Paracoccaceae bacterium]